MNGLLADLQYAVRMMRKSPAFTAVALLSLALGIGANTAVFSLIDAVMLRMLPIPNPQELVLLSEPGSGGISIGISTGDRALYTYPEYLALRDGNQVFSGLFAVQSSGGRGTVAIGRGAGKEPAFLKMVSGNFFSTLGVTPAMGRFFGPEEDQTAGAAPVAVISYDYWKRRFGLSADVLGQTVIIQRTPFSIVGVGPQGFAGDAVGEATDLWVPITMQGHILPGRDFLVQKPGSVEKVMWLRLAGRLKSGVDPAQAKASLNVLFQQFLQSESGPNPTAEMKRNTAETHIATYAGARGVSGLRSQFSEPLLVLMSFVGLVLLIACANLANLLLARSAAREREIGIRLAMGAGRGRLIRQLLSESLLLSSLGGALGILLAYWAARGLLVLAAGSGTPIPLDISPNLRLLAFALCISVVTGVLFGLLPALRITRIDLNPVLKESSRGVTSSHISRRGRRPSLGKSLVAFQVAVSLVLLIGAGLFARTLSNLASVKLGYDPERLLMLRLNPVVNGYKDAAASQLYERILERIGSVPGVRAVSVSHNGLFSGQESGDRISVEGYSSSNPKDLNARFDQVGPGYFHTVGIPLLLGREFTKQDSGTGMRVCLINETMAKFYFGDRNPIGKHVTDEFPDTRVTFEIVGVVKDAKYLNVREQTPRRFYLPFFRPLDGEIGAGHLMIRTNAEPSSVLSAVRREILGIDNSLEVDTARTVTEQIDRALTQDRLIAQLSTFFGVLALLLASIGLYGVMSYAIARRTPEIGIRMALGAQRRDVLRMVLRESLWMVVAGIVVGVPAAAALSKLVESRLFGLSADDPTTLSLAIAVLVCVGAVAALMPALKASRVDPLRALRYE